MNQRISRRDLMRLLGATGAAAGLAGFGNARLFADPPEAGKSAKNTTVHIPGKTKTDAVTVVDGRIVQPQRELTLLHKTGVLVVGGGPAGVCAAIAAARAGADVTLVERYGYFGGLWTGGLVLIVLGHIAKGPKQVCQGLVEEMMQRLDKLDRGIVDRKPGDHPTVDAEALKYVMLDMVHEAGVKLFLHCWGVDVVMDGNAVCGAVFESKSGRQAILAQTVVDTTGDGDLFAAAGAAFDHRTYHIGLPCRIGNVSPDLAKQEPKIKNLGGHTPLDEVNWVNMHGPDGQDGLDVAELTRLEIDSRRQIWKNYEAIRRSPGAEKVSLLETAPQLGVRITRVLKGTATLQGQDIKTGKTFPDVIAVGGSTDLKSVEWQIPYGVLVPEKVDNLLTAGRSISAAPETTEQIRLIPICAVTGHAAGVAAALAAKNRCPVRAVEMANLQKILREQGAYLG